MIKILPAYRLMPGMYVADLHRPWLRHGFILSRFLIRDQETSERIIAEGIESVSIDTTRGLDEPEPSDWSLPPWEGQSIRSYQRSVAPPISLEEERRRAALLLRKLTGVVRDLMIDAVVGRRVEAEKLAPFIDSMIDSVQRHPDGLLPLARLKSQDAYLQEHAAASALIVDDRCTCAPSFATEPLTECIDAVLYSTGYSKFADIGFGGFALLQDRLAYRRATVAYDARDLAALTARYKNALDEAREFTYQDSNSLDSAEPELRWDAYRQAVELHANLASDTKRAINHVYAHELPQDVQLPPVFQSWRFNIHVAQKDALLHEIARNGLFASNHYAALNGIFGPGSGRVASSLHGHIVNLFNDQYFDVERAHRLAELICNMPGLAPSPLAI